MALAVAAVAIVLTGMWLLPKLAGTAAHSALQSATPTVTFSLLAEPTQSPPAAPVQPSATTSSAPSPMATRTLRPTITALGADVNDGQAAITFTLEAAVPPERRIAEIMLWYDTATGHSLQRIANPPEGRIRFSHKLDAGAEGLTRTLTTTRELDYWWLVRDSAGETARAGGTAVLGPTLQALVTSPSVDLPTAGFTWAISSTSHFQFHYVPGTAAERDLRQLGALAEASLDRTSGALGIDFDGQMSIFFVPRVFWQGGATYGDKVQLISYLDRNYTGIEIWSYFTHEGTHALAQELLQPKENGGGPDGVLVEGLAVWASGGHYRQEPIDAWAAVVAGSSDYVSLSELRKGPFYEFQHETSYLEAASFVKFLIERYGLERLEELYGLETGEQDHDEALVRDRYGKGYNDLEADWLEYLAGITPTEQQEKIWRLKVRSFDLMRRYETELDPDARILPPKPPPEWTTDTLKIFLRRLDTPVNVALETALIEVQDRLYGGDLPGAERLLDDVEAALDAGGMLERPALQARQAILDLIREQDRAVLRSDPAAYRRTLDPASRLGGDEALDSWLLLPMTAYHQELVRLEVAGDGQSAEGVVLVHAQVAGGDFAEDGRLFSASFMKEGDRWLMGEREFTQPALPLPPPWESSSYHCVELLCCLQRLCCAPQPALGDALPVPRRWPGQQGN